MGKRIEDLRDLDDTPLEAPETDWYEFLEHVSEILPDYQWAKDTLEGIYETVEHTKRVTPGQRQAVDNIEAGGRRSRGRSAPNYFRRYQGGRR